MKKILTLLFVVLAFSVLLVSCESEPLEVKFTDGPFEEPFLTINLKDKAYQGITTWGELDTAFNSANPGFVLGDYAGEKTLQRPGLGTDIMKIAGVSVMTTTPLQPCIVICEPQPPV